MARANPIVIQGIDHVVLRVRDVGRVCSSSIATCWGARWRRSGGDRTHAAAGGRSLIDLVDVAGKLRQDRRRAAGARRTATWTISASASERLDAPTLQAYLQSKAVAPGEIVSRYGADGQGPSMYLNDPEGNTVELKGPPIAEGRGL